MARLLKKHFTGKDIFMQYCYLSQKWIKHEDDWINGKKKPQQTHKVKNLEKDTFWLR